MFCYYNTSTSAPGFSFLELIMYILIVGILALGGMFVYQRWINRARMETTKTNLRLLKNSIDIYYIEQNKYPNTLEDLIKENLLQKMPKDGWNQLFEYSVTPKSSNPYELYSYAGASKDDTDQENISAWDI